MEKAQKEIAKLKSKGFSYYGVKKDPGGYEMMDQAIISTAPQKAKGLDISKPIEDILKDSQFLNSWGIK